MAYRNRTIPETDAGLRRFVYSFSRQIEQNAAVYGFTAAEVAEIVALADELIEASIAASRMATRSRVTVAQRNDVQQRIMPTLRGYVQRIRTDRSLSAGDLARVGISPPKRRVSALPAPRQAPGMTLEWAGDRAHQINCFTTEGSYSTRTPRGATHLVLLCTVDDEPTASRETARYVGGFTRFPIRVPHAPADDGKVATYFAAWLMGNGEQSPWSQPVSMRIVTAGALPASMKLAA